MKKINGRKISHYLVLISLGIIILHACRSNPAYYFRSNYKEANSLLHQTDTISTKPFLKAHLKNGDVCIFRDTWKVDTLENSVFGSGKRYDFNRVLTYEGDLRLPIDSVLIFETNEKLKGTEKKRIAALTLLTALNLMGGAYCLTNPKACFGSCPTFYVNKNDNFHFANAEGFSNAILPSMEYYDIDALGYTPFTGNRFSLTMKNEALETHCLRDIKLMAYPRNEDQRIYQSRKNQFYICENNYSLSQALADEGNITGLLSSEDRVERFSLSDGANLSSKEEVFLEFEEVDNTQDLGFIINFRQTLMTTYFIYGAMGYMGDEVSDIFAMMEEDKETVAKLDNGIKKELGDIDVYVWNDLKEEWVFQGGFYETGPIAFNHQILPLDQKVKGKKLRIKLLMNKGLWRMDYVALTNIKEQVEPLELRPNQILNKGVKDQRALNELKNPEQFLISMPGDEFQLDFELPESDQEYELFLYSKGYYLEWMREHWIKDKNLLKLRQMFKNPKKFLSEEAESYKLYEANMEQEFWNSKIDTETFSYYEN